MDTASLRAALVSRASSNYRSCWVRVEQIIPEEVENFANIADVYNLWMSAATGRSAVALRPDGCPVEFEGKITRVFLGFYIWPSRLDLQYSLTVAMGKLGDARQVRPLRAFSAVLDLADRHALPYYMSSATVRWETPAFNAAGEQILPPPQPRLVDGIWLVWDEPLYGVIRVNGPAVGQSVILTMEFEREIISRPMTDDEIQTWRSVPGGGLILTPSPESTYDSHRITDIKNAITVHSPCGGDGVDKGDVETTTWASETTDIIIPECVKRALELCPGDLDDTLLNCDALPDKRVYYNACTGAVLGTEEGDDGSSYCSRIDTAPEASQPWLPKVDPQ